MSTNRRHKRKLKAEINVVPYIDVMLVLLIIFMVTAPLMNLGVDIELPESNAKTLNVDSEPVQVSIDAKGNMFLTLGKAEREATDEEKLVRDVSAYVAKNPKVPVLIGGDQSIQYGKVFEVMVLLQQAGVPKVGLMSRPPESKPK